MRPGTTAVTFRRSTRPRPGIAAGNVSAVSRGRARGLAGDPAAPRRASWGARRAVGVDAGELRGEPVRGSGSNVDSSVAGRRATARAGEREREASSGMATNSQRRGRGGRSAGRSSDAAVRKRRRRGAGRGRNGAAIVGRAHRAAMPNPATILLVDDEEAVQKLLTLSPRARRLPRRPGTRRRRGPRAHSASSPSIWSSSTSCCRSSTASRFASGSAPRATCRSSCSRRATTRWTRCSGSSSAPTTTSRSRSRSASFAAA